LVGWKKGCTRMKTSEIVQVANITNATWINWKKARPQLAKLLSNMTIEEANEIINRKPPPRKK
jgi:hypothetical protein